MRDRMAIAALGVMVAMTWAGIPACGALTFLRTDGQDMVDEGGRKILLRGVGLGNWMLPEGYMWKFGDQGDRPRKIEKIVSDLIGQENAAKFWSEYRRNYITQADIARIAELGFNSVRPALNVRLFLTEGDNAAYVDEGFQLLDRLVEWCRRHKVYVIIDMHGAPGGQTGANIDDSPADEPGLFMDKRNQDRLVDLWVKIAARYKDEPAVAAYDLLNEPLPQRTGAAEKYKDQLEPLYRRITEAIREVDPRHMITLEGADWANDWSVFSTPFDDNLFYQFHYYCWDRPDKLNDIGRFIERRKQLNTPVWVGETGEKDNAIYWATTQYFEANNIGWSFWPWKKMDATNGPCSIKAPAGWDAIRLYSRGGARPSPEAAQKAFDELIENIRLENCVFFGDVVNAMFRRAPVRIEAENFGPDGLNRSYYVKDVSQLSKQYRVSEPVPVESISGRDRWSSQQGIRLGEGEWTAYTVESLTSREYSVLVRAMAPAGPAVLELAVGGSAQELRIPQGDWTDIPAKAVALSRGANQIRVLVKSGTTHLDWIAVD
ncbi:MAG TPA: cellulase family glycosylhydrolase [Sedimentisphaerales bacterium]|nr:cellulase family glycosylhydrolase [Sedimentisphaerales bacterium]HNU28041.1 cellulase family glycosylhydrolase [Sedimentisphaerales bacterium]